MFEDKSAYLTSKHLDSPLIADELESLSKDLNNNIQTSNLFKTLRRSLSLLQDTKDTLDFFTGSIVKINNRLYQMRRVFATDLVDILDSETEQAPINAEVRGLARNLQREVRQALDKTINVDYPLLDMSNRASRYLSEELFLSCKVNQLSASCLYDRHKPIMFNYATPFSSSMILTPQLCLLINKHKKQIMIMTYDMLLSIKDQKGARGRAALLADALYPNSEMSDLISRQYHWQTDIIRYFGNPGYDIAKQTEALSKAYMTEMTKRPGSSFHPFKKMMEKLNTKIEKLKIRDSSVFSSKKMCMQVYETILRDATLQQVCELFGVMKLCGYPLIYVRKGGVQAAKEALEEENILEQDSKQILWFWRRSYIIGYIQKEGKWPNLEIVDKSKGQQIHRLHLANSQAIAVMRLHPSQFEYVSFKKTHDFNYYSDFMELMDDKSISLPVSDAPKYWTNKQDIKSSNRLLVNLISRKDFDVREICDRVEKRDVPEDWKIVSLYPKEKELKTAARMFSMMVLEMRTFFACLEANIADAIYPYLRPETMTKSKAEVTRIMFNISERNRDPTIIKILLECDLSRWNLRWRGHTVSPVGMDLNNLFGVNNLFNYVHEFFFESVIVCRVASVVPDGVEHGRLDDCDVVWRNHRGGFEGIAQKQWSICTFAMVESAMYKCGYQYELVGQGDNQVLAITVPRDNSLDLTQQEEESIARCLSILEATCKSVNQDLKPEECLESDSVITYSKYLYIDGALHYTSIKYGLKVEARTSEDVPSLLTDISGLGAGCIAASEHCTNTLIYHSVALLLLSIHLSYTVQYTPEIHEFGRPEAKISSREIYRLLQFIVFYPASFGGVSFPSVVDFMYRGGADPVGKDLSSVILLAQQHYYSQSVLQSIVDKNLIDVNAPLLRLLTDPYSLPVRSLEETKGRATAMISDSLQLRVANTVLKPLVSHELDTYNKTMIKTLSNLTPFMPLVAADIFNTSLARESIRLERSLTSTRTIGTIAKKGGLDPARELLSASYLSYVNVINASHNIVLCSYAIRDPLKLHKEILETYRSEWSKIIQKDNPDHPGVYMNYTVPPVLFKIKLSSNLTDNRGIVFLFERESLKSRRRGDYDLYLGSTTRDVRSEFAYKIVSNSRPVKAVEKFAQIAFSKYVGKGVFELCNYLSSHRCPISMDQELMRPHQISGVASHRYSSSLRSRGSYSLSRENESTCGLFFTDEIPGVSKTIKDYNIMFQEFFCYMLWFAPLNLELHPRTEDYLEVVVDVTSDMLQEVVDPIISLAESEWPEFSPQWANSQIIYGDDVSGWVLKGASTNPHLTGPPIESDITLPWFVENVVRAFMYSTIKFHSMSPGTYTSGKSCVRDLALDVAIIDRITAKSLIDACALVAVIEFSFEWLTSLAGSYAGRIPDLSIELASVHLAEILSTLNRYSSNVDDWSNRTYLHPDIPKFADDKRFGVQLIASLIKRRSWELLRATNTSRPIVYVYRNETGSMMSRIITSLIGIELFKLSKQSRLYTEVRIIAESIAMSEVLFPPTEAGKLHGIRKFFKVFRTHGVFSKQTLQAMNRLEDSLNVFLVDSDINESLRLIRQLPTKALDADYPTLMIMKPMKRVAMDRIVRIYNLINTSIIPSDMKEQMMLSLRFSGGGPGRYWGLWRGLINQASKKYAYVIGVGTGVCVDVLLNSGVKAVLGYDIGSDHLAGSILKSRPPIACISNPNASKFSWSKYSFQITSRTSLESVIMSEKDSWVDDSVIVIDISPKIDLQQLLMICNILPEGSTLICRFNSAQFSSREVSLLSEHRLHLEAVIILSKAGRLEVWIKAVVQSQIPAIAPMEFPLDRVKHISLSDHRSPIYQDARAGLGVLRAVYERFTISNGTVEELTESSVHLLALISDDVRRQSFVGWGEKIIQLIAISGVLYPVDTINSLQFDDTNQVMSIKILKSLHLSVNLSRRVRKFMQGPFIWMIHNHLQNS